ncbi:MAG: hypothetical protein CFE43_18620 [Burkholderiales bacterium PBB3]|nr:MAG: hypothetical protein CFE43_18620 [Burkholderiales bacterium PBB3]
MLKLVCIGVLALASLTAAVAAVPEGAKAAAPPVRKPVKKVPASKPVPPPPPAPAALPELSPELLLVAEKVVLGTVPCELGAKVVVKQDSNAGRFVLELGRQTFRMEPTLTTTGAIRLEDPATGVVWLQLGNKSMLLNQRLGKRLADACVNLHQAAIATALEHSKAPGLLDDKTPEPPQPAASR